jgi:hypothetical protein
MQPKRHSAAPTPKPAVSVPPHFCPRRAAPRRAAHLEQPLLVVPVPKVDHAVAPAGGKGAEEWVVRDGVDRVHRVPPALAAPVALRARSGRRLTGFDRLVPGEGVRPPGKRSGPLLPSSKPMLMWFPAP